MYYTHNFCNTGKIERSTPDIPCTAHNFFGFDLFYYLKGYTTFAWFSKTVNVGGTNLTHANFRNITREIRLIDSLKFYQRSLSELSSTFTSDENRAVIKLTEKILKEHFYFLTVWQYLNLSKQNEILDILSGGKGVIPYKIIVDMESFFIKPDSDFWEKTEFSSKLKQSAVNDQDYEHSKFLYQTLKMRNLGDLNDLYNTQDELLLAEIIEIRFHWLQNTYGFNQENVILVVL